MALYFNGSMPETVVCVDKTGASTKTQILNKLIYNGVVAYVAKSTIALTIITTFNRIETESETPSGCGTLSEYRDTIAIKNAIFTATVNPLLSSLKIKSIKYQMQAMGSREEYQRVISEFTETPNLEIQNKTAAAGTWGISKKIYDTGIIGSSSPTITATVTATFTFEYTKASGTTGEFTTGITYIIKNPDTGDFTKTNTMTVEK